MSYIQLETFYAQPLFLKRRMVNILVNNRKQEMN